MTHVVVVGDVVLDRDVIGSADRLCPDAPVAVVDETSRSDRPGGAGLVATLAATFGADVTLVAAFAGDTGGRRLRTLLGDRGVAVSGPTDDGSTCEKQRVRVAGQSLLRIDRGGEGRLSATPTAALDAIGGADVVIVSDYGRSLLGDPALRAAIGRAAHEGCPVVWDPHPRGHRPVDGATLVTPNQAEAERFAHELEGDRHSHSATLQSGLSGIATRAFALRRSWAASGVAVTLGGRGAMLVHDAPAPVMLAARRVVSVDPCGAGDAFAVAAGLALAAGDGLAPAVEAAVRAATDFVRGGVTDTAAPAGCVVATGGCFDVLHPGHIATLEAARAMGDRLIVLVNSDASVRRLKGTGRPAQTQADRVAVLRALSCVDDVIVFDEDTPVEALRRLRPMVFVKGGDYSAQEIPEATAMAEWGGAVATVPFVDGRSTTRILTRLTIDSTPRREHDDAG